MDNLDDRPPFFDSWKSIYRVVLFNLVLMIALMYLFSKYFA